MFEKQTHTDSVCLFETDSEIFVCLTLILTVFTCLTVTLFVCLTQPVSLFVCLTLTLIVCLFDTDSDVVCLFV